MEAFKEWWKQPFATDMDVPGWFLFFGLLICISVLWAMGLNMVRKATSV